MRRNLFRIALAALVPLVAQQMEGQSLVSTVAGTEWLFPSASLPGTQAPLGQMFAAARENANVLIADRDNHLIFRLDAS